MSTNGIITGKVKLVILAFLVSSISMAQGTPQKKQGHNKCMLPDLTEEQKEKISDSRIEHKQQMLLVKTDIKVLSAELEQLSIAEKPDMNKINAKIDELTAKKALMMKASSKHRQEVRALLTDEQRVVFDSKAGQMHNRAHGNKNGEGFAGSHHAHHKKRGQCPGAPARN